jgi:guanine deaminase
LSLVKNKIFLSNLLNPVSDKSAQWLPDTGLWLEKIRGKSEYRIKKIQKNSILLAQAKKLRSVEVIDKTDIIMTPTFCDLHFHWVQDDVRDMPKDDLLFWLKNYTWPTENKFKSASYTKKKIKSFSKQLVQSGTLSGGCYSSIHSHATELAIEGFPGEIIIGNVQMTMNSPDYLLQTKEDCLKTTRCLSKKYKARYAVTPRFAITTHPDVMNKSAGFAKKNQSFIQTHLSETKEEVQAVMDIYSAIPGFEKVKSYTEVYEKSGILGPKTIMGHGIYLNQKELRILKNSRTAIAHCPTSNAPISKKGLGSGLFDLKTISKNKIRWALGSDIGAGPYLSMVDVLNSFVSQHKDLGLANFTSAFYRATLAGEKILQESDRRGSFKVGKDGSFLCWKVNSLAILKNKTPEEVLRKVFFVPSSRRDDCGVLNQSTVWKGQKLY